MIITYTESRGPNGIEADDNEQLFSLGHRHKPPIVLVQRSHIRLEIQDECLSAGRKLRQHCLVQPDKPVPFRTCVVLND